MLLEYRTLAGRANDLTVGVFAAVAGVCSTVVAASCFLLLHSVWETGPPSDSKLYPAALGFVGMLAGLGLLFTWLAGMAARDAYRRLGRIPRKLRRGWNGIGLYEPPPLRRLRRR